MTSPDAFETLRLHARRPTQDDLPVLRAIHTDAGTMRTLSADGSLLPESGTQAVLDRHLAHWQEHGFGIWLFAERVSGENIGYCGLRNCTVAEQQEIELFYGIHSAFFRQGYGTEMAQAVLNIGFDQLALKEIVAFTLDDNTASRALMSKLGMQYESEIEHAGLPHVLYRLTR